MAVAKVGSQLESIDKKTEDTMNSLKELQQVCANVLKEFHQVSVFLIIFSSFNSNVSSTKKTAQTLHELQHALHLYKNIPAIDTLL